MVALRNARARRYVLLCHFFCFWHFATRTLQFSFLPPNSKLLKDVERNGVPNWIRERMCELGYDENIANKAVETLSTFTMPVQSDVPDNVKAFARALDDAELEGQIFKTETSSFKLQNASEI
eukprot:s4705_g8.t1